MLIIRTTIVAELILFGISTWCQAQVTPPRGITPPVLRSGTTVQMSEVEVPFMREKLVIELAKTAAENGSQDLSFEAFARFIENFTNEPIAPQTQSPRSLQQQSAQAGVQSSLLGSPGVDPFSGSPFSASGSQIISSRITRNVFVDPSNFLPQIFELVQTWKKEKFDAERVSLVLQHAVMPPSKPEAVRLLAVGLRQSMSVVPRTVTTTINTPNGPQTTTTTVYSSVAMPPNSANSSFGQAGVNTIQRFRSPNIVAALGLQMVDWAAQAKRIDPLLEELKKRSASSEGQYAHALIVYALRSQGRPDQAAAYVDELVEKKQLASNYWEILVQASMQPLAKDWEDGRASLNDLSIATETLPTDSRNRLLQHALKMDLIGTAPYFQHCIRGAIQAEDVKRVNELVPDFVKQVEAASAANSGRNNVENNIWNEVIAECYRANRPYMALKALRYVQERATAQNLPAPPTRDEARLNALLGLCDLPIEKRMSITRALVLDETINAPENFSFASFPDSQAPNYFRSPEWQAKAKLLQADPEVSTISLLDVLLSDAETSGKLDETIDKIFERLPVEESAKANLSRLLCEWISLRAEVRKQPIPQRIATESAKLAAGEAFQEWYFGSDTLIRFSLAAGYKRKPDSPAGKFIIDLEKGVRNPVLERSNIGQASDGPSASWSSSENLKHWLAFAVPEPPNSQAFAGYGFASRPWLTSAEHKVWSRNTSAALMFKYPLKGNYAISFQVLQSGDDWSRHAFGGVINGTFLEYRGRSTSGSRESLAAMSGRLTSSLNSTFRMSKSPDKTQDVTIECAYHDDRVSLSINGEKLAHTQFTSHSFPFAALLPVASPQGAVKFTGSPEIAQSVNLLDSSFSGWSARRYDRLLTNGLNLQTADQPPPVAEPTSSNLASWKMENNALRSDGSLASGNRTSDPQQVVRKSHNCMIYSRPLLDGERFEYEVWQDSSTPAAAPVIGLTALMIEGDRIRLHWMPTAREVAGGGIAVDNRADDPLSEQLGEAKLNNDQWNKVSLRVEGNQIYLSINGSDVYRRPIPVNSTTEFGWLSNPEQPSIRIRHATLKGNWPSQLPSDLWETK